MRRVVTITGILLLTCWMALSIGRLLIRSAVALDARHDASLAELGQAIPIDLLPSRSARPAISFTPIHTRLLPVVFTPPPPLPPPFPPPLLYTGTYPVDFPAERALLQNQGQELAFNKVGFHTGLAANDAGLTTWMNDLDAAGVPIFLKSVDNAEPLYYAQQLIQAGGISHTLIYRRAGHPWDVPDYNLPPKQAAQQHWAMHLSVWPPELDPSIVWIETVNELDKNRSGWVGEFALETALLALRDGYRWAGFGWSSGEPEPEHWVSPAMLSFLQLAADNPTNLAVSLHEYSYTVDDIALWYPYLVGRFQSLFQVCDDHFIPRPTVFITEWGWTYDNLPDPAAAMKHIRWASWLYAAYPEVKGAAIWYLGGGFGIDGKAQLLIDPVRQFSLNHFYAYTPGTATIDPALFVPDWHSTVP